MIRETFVGACALALAAGTASAQVFEENFDSYSVGDLCAQSTWQPWTAGADVCGEVSDEVFLSGSKSLFIEGAIGGSGGGGDDTVHTFSGIEGGQWSFAAMTYLPSTADGTASFILLNTFPATSNEHWSVVIEFDSFFGEITVWPGTFTGALIKPDEWVEVRVDFDLDADTAKYYYDGVEIWEDTWTAAIAAGGALRLQAVDLYAGEPGSGHTGMFFDDITLTGDSACYPDCDGSGTLDFFDFLCFQNAFATGDPYADCDGTGALDFFDFLCFQNEFAVGCP
ncbi:MAG: hypothetical protein ACF8R7_14335 [Phycisphaerales bacterium JB039]